MNSAVSAPPLRQAEPWHAAVKAGREQCRSTGSGIRAPVLTCAALLLVLLAGCGPEATTERPSTAAAKAVDVRASREAAGAPESPSSPAPTTRFREAAAAVGVDFQRHDDMTGLHRIMESNGGGVALLDYDGDGWLDVFFTNGCRLPLRARTGAHTNRFYRNQGGDRFTDVTDLSHLRLNGYCHGCAVGDYDNDGFDDLYVTAFGDNRLYRNNGDGTFIDTTEEASTNSDKWSSSSAWADMNGDGNLDLYVVNYVQTGDDPPELCPDPASPDGYLTCPPTVFAAADDVLFLSDGAGRFIDVTRDAGIVGLDGKGLGVAILDLDRRDGPDIYVANDGMPNFLYVNQPRPTTATTGDASPGAATRPAGEKDGRADVEAEPGRPVFRDEATARGAAVNQLGTAEASMGVAHGDVDGDGWLDLLLTHFYTETNTLYLNESGTGFRDATRASRLGAPSRLSLGFGTELLDVDNDGWLDCFVANGHVDDLRWQPTSPPYAMQPQLFRNAGGGRFEDVSAVSGDYFAQTWLGRGAATGDLDNDGDLDLVVSHQRTPSAVLFNEPVRDRDRIALTLIGKRSNRSAINAWVEAVVGDRTLVREIAGGGGYQSAADQTIHLGLGEQTGAAVLIIHWPSGATSRFKDVPAGRYVARESEDRIWELHPMPPAR